MKKNSIYMIMVTVFVLIIIATVVRAGSVYGRTVVTLSTTAGTKTWTNSSDYAAINLKRLWCPWSSNIVDTVTVTRVTSDSIYTQSVGSVIASKSTNVIEAAYLKPGDKLTFAGAGTTQAVIMLEYEVQQH